MKIAQLFLFFICIIYTLTCTGSSIISNDSTSSNEPANSISREAIRHKIITTYASVTGDACTNLAGGLKQGTTCLWMLNLNASLETQHAGLWRGGQLFVNMAAINGKSPSENLTGDFQVISNIDGGNHLFLQECWYKQTFRKTEITIGLQDMNIEFAGNSTGSLFINSSFGIPPVISNNIPAPLFPLTAPGITIKTALNNNINLLAAVYDGCPTAFEQNTFNLRWHLQPEDGKLFVSEFQFSTNFKNLPGNIKTGYYYHTGLTEAQPDSGINIRKSHQNYGLYLISDLTILKSKTSHRTLNFFYQLATSTSSVNAHNSYTGAGFTFSGFSRRKPEDAVGIAIANAGFSAHNKKSETTIESFYIKYITPRLFIQADLQYIIHPAGFDTNLPNALAGVLRIGLSLE